MTYNVFGGMLNLAECQWQDFTASIALLMTTSTLGLGRKCC